MNRKHAKGLVVLQGSDCSSYLPDCNLYDLLLIIYILSFCKRFNKNIDIKFSAQIEQIIATYIILIKIKMASTLNILRQKSYHIFSNFMGGEGAH